MTQPIPTQVRHPWRATLRTAIAAAVAVLPLVPTIVSTAHLEAVPLIGGVVVFAAAVTRILAHPDVEVWLRQYVPWLAAQSGPQAR